MPSGVDWGNVAWTGLQNLGGDVIGKEVQRRIGSGTRAHGVGSPFVKAYKSTPRVEPWAPPALPDFADSPAFTFPGIQADTVGVSNDLATLPTSGFVAVSPSGQLTQHEDYWSAEATGTVIYEWNYSTQDWKAL